MIHKTISTMIGMDFRRKVEIVERIERDMNALITSMFSFLASLLKSNEATINGYWLLSSSSQSASE
jgi:hypothetical protein